MDLVGVTCEYHAR